MFKLSKLSLVFFSFAFFTKRALSDGIPYDLYINAVTENIPYIEEFDYKKLHKTQNFTVFNRKFPRPSNQIDEVVVYKSQYKMLLMKNDNVVKSYWIALSDRPVGKKEYEGDRRTPEGTYALDYVNNHSFYYRAYHISYPNLDDLKHAREINKRPGGQILIHGLPENQEEFHDNVQKSNWTNGCISILNPEIDEFIRLVDIGTPIIIYP